MVEEVCEEREITLVVHPAIRTALRGFEGAFSMPAAAYLQGDARAVYFLPLAGGGDVKLVFALRYSAGEHLILRVEPEREDGLARVKEAVHKSATSK
jgi:hypothetical protein